MIFIKIKDIISNIIEFLFGKLTPVLFIFLIFLFFLPERFINILGLKGFKNDYIMALGLLFLYSFSYILFKIFELIYKKTKDIYKIYKIKKEQREQLEEMLSDNQRKILSDIYFSETQSDQLSVQDASVTMLEMMNVIFRPNISVRLSIFNYTLQPWVREYLDKNADDYFKDLY